jgi:hypothetical protein
MRTLELKRHSKVVITLLAVCFLAVACASVDITKTSSGFYDPSDPNTVQILKTRPTRTYEELGTITAYRFSASETAVMHNAIRAKAAALGADAAILTEEGFNDSGHWAMGVAIRYTGPAK